MAEIGCTRTWKRIVTIRRMARRKTPIIEFVSLSRIALILVAFLVYSSAATPIAAFANGRMSTARLDDVSQAASVNASRPVEQISCRPPKDLSAIRRPLSLRRGDQYGYSVSISGRWLAISAPGNRGVVYVFIFSRGRWRLERAIANPGKPINDFGFAVSLSGTTLAVSAIEGNGGRGTVYVYARSGRRWYEQAKIPGREPLPVGCGPEGGFGWAISASGNTMVIGDPFVNTGDGTAFVYKRSVRGKWQVRAKFNGHSSPTVSAEFGSAVAISGATISIGALGARNNRGEVFVYTHSARGWLWQATLAGPRNSNFGGSIDASGSTVIIGAYPTDHNIGRAYVYERSGVRWWLRAKLTTPRGKVVPTGQFFAYPTTVALSGVRALIGNPQKNPHRCGAVYEYVRSDNRWKEREEVRNPGCSGGDEYGAAIALSGTVALIGAFGANNLRGAAYIQSVP